jgi:hypothetical protein
MAPQDGNKWGTPSEFVAIYLDMVGVCNNLMTPSGPLKVGHEGGG